MALGDRCGVSDQGEAAKAADAISPPFRNTADDSQPDLSHYEKFCQIRERALPNTYSVKDPSEYVTDDLKRLKILGDNFERFTAALGDLLAGVEDLPRLARQPGGKLCLVVADRQTAAT